MLCRITSVLVLPLVVAGPGCAGRSTSPDSAETSGGSAAEGATGGSNGQPSGGGSGGVGGSGDTDGGTGGTGSGATGGSTPNPVGGSGGDAGEGPIAGSSGDGAGGHIAGSSGNGAGGFIAGASGDGAGGFIAGSSGDGAGGFTAGAAGTVVIGGTGGVPPINCDGGMAGADACRGCTTWPHEALVESCIKAGDMTYLTEPVSESVTVTAVDEVPAGNCAEVDGSYSSAPALRVGLETIDMERFTVFLRAPGLTSAFTSVGEVLQLEVAASNRFGPTVIPQTLSLSRDGKVLVFGAAASNSVLGLEALGVSLVYTPQDCLRSSCSVIQSMIQVTAGAEQATFSPGQTKNLGPYSLTVDENSSLYGAGIGGCDGSGLTRMAGVGL